MEWRKLWVLEWRCSCGDWCAVEGDNSLRRMQKKMRKWREDSPKEKFRVVKYVPIVKEALNG